ncbi:Heavy metal-associated isoprenylated plant protein 26 [Platanthera guangdongensis]|uniref:Heavy metal-associated isoprenylated plant protein 26 n=1 Tax=Platanthera guangdongensis TaxID=2320717 RepID=A0ABR2LEV4_9ASPA
MDCDRCELKVKKVLSSMKGLFLIWNKVKSVDINMKQKVTVTSYVEPNKMLKVQATGKKIELWHYVPYGLVTCWKSPLKLAHLYSIYCFSLLSLVPHCV